ncbi:MAG: hypothetical protein HY326_08060 [Chloroflexi bacterium]|nr:hypothetical protein [Chloroflexota bacterium]
MATMTEELWAQIQEGETLAQKWLSDNRYSQDFRLEEAGKARQAAAEQTRSKVATERATRAARVSQTYATLQKAKRDYQAGWDYAKMSYHQKSYDTLCRASYAPDEVEAAIIEALSSDSPEMIKALSDTLPIVRTRLQAPAFSNYGGRVETAIDQLNEKLAELEPPALQRARQAYDTAAAAAAELEAGVSGVNFRWAHLYGGSGPLAMVTEGYIFRPDPANVFQG